MKISTHLNVPIRSDEDLYRYIKPALDDLRLPKNEYAAKYENFEIPSMVLNIRFRRHGNQTLLHLIIAACADIPVDRKNNATNFLRFLLANGANPDIKADGGHTALHLAASLHDVGCIYELVTANADLNALDDHELSAIDLAANADIEDQDAAEAADDAILTLKIHGAFTGSDLAKMKFHSKDLPPPYNNNGTHSDDDSLSEIESLQFRLEGLEEEKKNHATQLQALNQQVATLTQRLEASQKPEDTQKQPSTSRRTFFA